MENLEKKIDEVLSRGVGEFIDPDNTFRKKLVAKASGLFDGEIIIKYGVDPTRPDIHLGHAVCFRKLRQLQELGCKIIFLVGDFTAMIGDPTGKSKTRPKIDLDEVRLNVKTYLDQVGRLLVSDDSKQFDWIPNSDWYVGIHDMFADEPSTELEKKVSAWKDSRFQGKLRSDNHINTVTLVTFILNGLKQITYARLIERDMFQDRIASGRELYMHEMLYPVFQGLDSCLIYNTFGACDLEVGGTDQTFNMLVGRHLMESNPASSMPPQAVLSFRLLEGLDGKEKMSKSLNNYIAITDTPNEMLGKVMSLPDTSIVNYFKLCTDISLSEIEVIEAKLGGELNPRDAKLRLAKEIVTIYHGTEEAEKAEGYFIQAFSKKEIPDDIREVKLSESVKLIDFLVEQGLATSKGDARRKIEQGGVSLDGEKLTELDMLLESVHAGRVMKVGKKDFVKIVF